MATGWTSTSDPRTRANSLRGGSARRDPEGQSLEADVVDVEELSLEELEDPESDELDESDDEDEEEDDEPERLSFL